jgi:prolipoprotein diacylglyceryltransferase
MLVSRWVAVAVLLGVVLAVLLAVRQVNSSTSVRCNQQHACVDAIDRPFVAVRS